MSIRVFVGVVGLAVLFSGSSNAFGQPAGQGQPPDKKPAAAAQKPADAKDVQRPAEPAKEQTPAQKAMAEARKITDPDKKIEALRQLIKDFPTADEVESANYMILTALTGKAKDDGKKILEHMKALIEAEPEQSRGEVYGNMASNLLGQDALLADAETFARKSLELITEDTWAAARRKQFSEMNARRLERDPKATPIEVPDAAELRKTFIREKQSNMAVLGRILQRRGKLAEAQRTLREAYQLDPKGSSVGALAVELAEFAKLAGKDADQLEFLTVAALHGRLTADSRKDLETVYRRTHGGAVDGLEAMLDARYEKENPRPVTGQPYQKAPGRTDRVVLAELFTGAGCPPCVGADLAFEAALERYSPAEMALLVYHVHVPRPDPMTNPSTQTREKLYGSRGVPAFYFDGEGDGKGGGDAGMAGKIYSERILPVVDKRLATKPDAKVTVTANRAGSKIVVRTSVETKAVSKKLRLQLALVEERLRYSGENGVRFHPKVVRALASMEKEAQGFAIATGKQTVEYTFDLEQVMAEAKAHLDEFEKTSERFPGYTFVEKKHQLDPGKISVVAFVQDEETKKVLQAVVVNPSAVGQ